MSIPNTYFGYVCHANVKTNWLPSGYNWQTEMSITDAPVQILSRICNFSYSRLISGFCLNQIRLWTSSGENSDFFLKLKKIKNSKKMKFFLTSYSHSSINFRKLRIYHFDFECTKFKNSNWSIIFNLVSKVSIYFGFFSSSNKKRLMRMRNLIENSMNEECDFGNDIKTFHSISKSSF